MIVFSIFPFPIFILLIFTNFLKFLKLLRTLFYSVRSDGSLLAALADFLKDILAFSRSLLNHFLGFCVLYFFTCPFVVKLSFAALHMISVSLLFASLTPSEFSGNLLIRKFSIFSLIFGL